MPKQPIDESRGHYIRQFRLVATSRRTLFYLVKNTLEKLTEMGPPILIHLRVFLHTYSMKGLRYNFKLYFAKRKSNLVWLTTGGKTANLGSLSGWQDLFIHEQPMLTMLHGLILTER
jgi:hypothetical protein